MDELLTGFPALPDVDGPVWGIDPSSKRIALGILTPGPELRWDTTALPQVAWAATRFGQALDRHIELFETWVEQCGRPVVVYIEEPFIPRDHRSEPMHLFMYGVTLAAIGRVCGGVDLVEVGPSRWKAKALGAGHGGADKPEILRWAQTVGYTGQVQDIADAIGVCVAGAVLRNLQRRPVAA